MRVFACYVVSKLQCHRCPTFGAFRRVQTGRYIFILLLDLTVTQITLSSSCKSWGKTGSKERIIADVSFCGDILSLEYKGSGR
jgi:hypothetical protein